MFTKWNAHLPAKDKDSFIVSAKAAQTVLRRLKDLIDEEIESSIKEQGKKDYTEAAWAYSQADSIGEQRAYKKVLKLVENII